MHGVLLVVGYNLQPQREVHIRGRPLAQWRALGYGRRETLVCFNCFRGISAPAGTKVLLMGAGASAAGPDRTSRTRPPSHRLAGPTGRPSGTSTPSTASPTRLAPRQASPAHSWGSGPSNAARRADVHVVLVDGARPTLQAQRELITDEQWQGRHRAYAPAGLAAGQLVEEPECFVVRAGDAGGIAVGAFLAVLPKRLHRLAAARRCGEAAGALDVPECPSTEPPPT
ncbi:hypothetical protein [Streptomyces sp. NPDC046197]|uniref:hypothetical protein n=1 Tax=Streptomyces sp. NPDC046197 TaxID=3154337 RepID=UPI0033EF8101